VNIIKALKPVITLQSLWNYELWWQKCKFQCSIAFSFSLSHRYFDFLTS